MYDWRPYVPVAARRRSAQREVDRLRKKGQTLSPVSIEGRAIACTFWGKAWCDNLEQYSDYENRLPRGRTYVRNGSVLDLQVAPGEVQALVSGSELYRVAVKVAAVPKALWKGLCTDCAGAIDSLVELLQGRFSKAVMARLCRQETGLFPAPAELKFSCSCPDWASMCKHVAAVLYGVGARLDEEPSLLFRLRRVDEADLLAGAADALPLSRKGPAAGRVLADEGLSDLFGVDLAAGDGGEERPSPTPAAKARPRRRGGKDATEKPEPAVAPAGPAAPRAKAEPKPEAKPSAASKAAQKPSAARKPRPTPPKVAARKVPAAAAPPATTPRIPAALAGVDPSSPLAELYERLLGERAEGRREKPWKKARRR